MSAIFDFSCFQTWHIMRSGLIRLPDLENMGIAIGIPLLSCIEAEIYVISYLLPINGSHFWFLTDPNIGHSYEYSSRVARPRKQYLCSPFLNQHVQCMSFSLVVFKPSIPHSCLSVFNLLISSRMITPLKFVNFNLLASFSNWIFIVILFTAFKFQTTSGFPFIR